MRNRFFLASALAIMSAGLMSCTAGQPCPLAKRQQKIERDLGLYKKPVTQRYRQPEAWKKRNKKNKRFL